MQPFWKHKAFIPTVIIVGVLLIDQIVKFVIKTNFYYGEEIPVLGNFFTLHFVENPGFAFGMTLGGSAGKLFLTLFRIVAIVAIGWYIVRMIKENATAKIVIVSFALIFAGALGNIIDSCFYGLLFSESSYHVAEFLPEGGGYAPLFYGNVVDMFSFSIFPPIFNIADSAITIGVFLLLIHFIFFEKSKKKEVLSDDTEADS